MLNMEVSIDAADRDLPKKYVSSGRYRETRLVVSYHASVVRRIVLVGEE
jgi:hypothetical protein